MIIHPRRTTAVAAQGARDVDLMSLAVALQSVLYYVVACSPCRQCAHRRRRKREAGGARQRSLEVQADEVGRYRHPSPFSTNIYWRHELALGPGPPAKRSGKGSKGSQRRLVTPGTASSVGSGDGLGTSTTVTSLTRHRADSHDGDDGRHQRADEVLWGHDEASAFRWPYRPSLGVALGESSTGTTSPEPDHITRHPPPSTLNHASQAPIIISTPPAFRAESRWMLQPPPSARMMDGKKPLTDALPTSTRHPSPRDRVRSRQPHSHWTVSTHRPGRARPHAPSSTGQDLTSADPTWGHPRPASVETEEDNESRLAFDEEEEEEEEENVRQRPVSRRRSMGDFRGVL